MRLFALSVLSTIVMLPNVAAARLPVVNVSAGGVSARSAFGDLPQQKNVKSVQNLYGDVPSETPAVTVAPVPNRVVQNTGNIAARSVVSRDVGEKISQTVVLTPNRPSSDLWAQNDIPLRVPNANEFAVIRSDAKLPEEKIDAVPRSQRPQMVATATRATTAPSMRKFDSEIERLTQLQKRADASFATASNPVRVASMNTVAPESTASHERTVVGRVPSATDTASQPAVKLSRLVVPMDDDIVMRSVKKSESPRIASVRDDMRNLSPTELRQAFRKTFLSENKHLSTYPVDARFDVASDMSSDIEGFTSRRDLSEGGGIRPLEIKIRFRNSDSALSRDNYNLLTEYASVVLNNPTRAIQVAIPQSTTVNSDDRKLAARRLAIVEQVLRDAGVSENRIMPVLSSRSDDSFVLRIISSDQYETMTQQQKNMFGDTIGKKSYKSMAW